jgi:AAA15 family ATPase/GTPase
MFYEVIKMLSYFRVQNFKSILDMKVDFSYAEGKAPNNYQNFQRMPFLETADKKSRVIPCMSIYGANASGKTNIIEALYVYRNIIMGTQVRNRYFPNKLNTKYNFTIFELEFFVDSIKFKHYIEYNNTEIIRESLLKNNEIIYFIDNTRDDNEKYQFNSIVNEQYDDKKIKNIVEVECCFKKDNHYLQRRVFMSVIAAQYAGLSEDIKKAYDEFGKIFISMSNDISGLMERTLNDLKENKQDTLNRISNVIQKFDIDIVKIDTDVKRIPKEEARMYDYMSATLEEDNNILRFDSVNSYHKTVDGKEIVFNMKTEESKGTYMLFGLLIKILFAFEDGGIIIIDELDRSIHPLILSKIIELFKDKDYNKTNAQLIFTSHCADILDMDILRVSEIAIINKTLTNGSTFSRLSDFKNIRNTTDFRKSYLNGTFSGIPFPYI